MNPQRPIFLQRRRVQIPWRTIASFVAGVLFASLVLGMTKARADEFKVDTGKREVIYQVKDCIKARDRIVKRRTKGSVGIKFYCNNRSI